MTIQDLQTLTNDAIKHEDIGTMWEMKETFKDILMNEFDKKDIVDLIDLKLEEMGEL